MACPISYYVARMPRLAQILDLANHLAIGATAEIVSAEGEISLVAKYALSAGDEVTLCYDVEADYMDVLER